MDFLYNESFETHSLSTETTDDGSSSSAFVDRRKVTHKGFRVLKIGDRLPDPPKPKSNLLRDVQCPPSLVEQIDASQLQKSLEGSLDITSNCIEKGLLGTAAVFEGTTSQKNKGTASSLSSSMSPTFINQLANPCQPVDAATEALLLSAEKGIETCIADPRHDKQHDGPRMMQPSKPSSARGRRGTPRRTRPNNRSSRSGSRTRRPPNPPPACDSSSEDEQSSQMSSARKSVRDGRGAVVVEDSSRFRRSELQARQKESPFDEPSVIPSDDDEHQPRRGDPYRSLHSGSCDTIFLVGNEQFLLSSASLKLDWRSLRHLMDHNMDGHHNVVDLTNHSSEEWIMVVSFLKRFTGKKDFDWQTLPIVLPWLVDFHATGMLKEVDEFILASIVGVGQNFRGESSFPISDLMLYTKIAYTCHLERCQSQARRLLRLKLLKPSKPTESYSSANRSFMADDEPEMELAWTLDDLQMLSRIMKSFDDLRDFLWEYAVIVYLPHDLDVSDSLKLVSNSLFPYLLREGMMQMMIVEEMESANKSIDDRNRFGVQFDDLNEKQSKDNTFCDPSTSGATTCSATTVPTTPAPIKLQTQEEIHDNLHRIEHFLDKYEHEKDVLNMTQVSSDSSYMSAGSLVVPIAIDKRHGVNITITQKSTKSVHFQPKHRGEC